MGRGDEISDRASGARSAWGSPAALVAPRFVPTPMPTSSAIVAAEAIAADRARPSS